MRLPKYIYLLILKSISLFFLFISIAQASNVKNSATVFMYHKFGVSKYPSTSVTINQLESHINELIKECIKNLNEDNYTIKLDEKNIVQTSGRPIQLKRAFQNIIDNSKRYGDKIEIKIFLDESGCNIDINDNGEGIPKEKYEDVFKPFYTLDPSRNKLKGESGLGLTITRDIIRSHGGEIKLDESELGGLKLSVLLPI